jgi:hypothetical protein
MKSLVWRQVGARMLGWIESLGHGIYTISLRLGACRRNTLLSGGSIIQLVGPEIERGRRTTYLHTAFRCSLKEMAVEVQRGYLKLLKTAV